MTAVNARHYLPEVHDVHPGSVGPLAELLAALPDAARAVAALLVVPNYRHANPSDHDPGFCDWLRRTGGDVVVHGLAHEAPDTLWNRFWYGSPNDAEFSRLDRKAARRVLAAATAVVARASGRAPRWFCAPRWDYSRGTVDALREAGLEGWMLRGALERADGVRVDMPAVWFDDGPRPWRKKGAGVLRRRRVARLLRAERPFRVALHPGDAADSGIRHEIEDLIAQLTGNGWLPVSLSEAVATRGAARSARDDGGADAREG